MYIGPVTPAMKLYILQAFNHTPYYYTVVSHTNSVKYCLTLTLTLTLALTRRDTYPSPPTLLLTLARQNTH